MVDVYPFPFDNLKFSLEWLSAVTVGYHSEQRDVLRQVPRLLWEGSNLLPAADARYAETILLSSGGEFLLPDWRYAQRVKPVVLGASSELKVDPLGWPFVVGEQVSFHYKQHNAKATVTAIGAGTVTVDIDVTAFVFPIAWMIPLHEATLTGDVTHSLIGNDQVSTSVTAVVTDYRDLSAHATVELFNGVPVVTKRDFMSSISYQGLNNYDVTDNEVGRRTVNQTTRHQRTKYALSMLIQSSNDMLSTEAYLHTLAGRVTAFWKPSWLPDYLPKWVSLAGDTQLFIQPPARPSFEHVDAICIAYADGTVARHAVSLVAVSEYLMTLSLDTPLVKTVNSTTVLTISRMGLHRLDTDSISFTIESGFATAFSVPTIEVLH